MSLSRMTSRVTWPFDRGKPLLTRAVGTRWQRVGGVTCSCKANGRLSSGRNDLPADQLKIWFSTTTQWCVRKRDVACRLQRSSYESELVVFFFRWVLKITKRDHQLRRICLPVLLSARNNCVPHWKNFHEIWYSSIFRKSVETVQVPLQSDNNNRYFTWRPIYIISRSFLLRMKHISDKIYKSNQWNHFVFNNIFFPRKSYLLWENVGKKNVVERFRPQMAIWRMRIACWKS